MENSMLAREADMKKSVIALSLSVLATATAVSSALAQQTTGTPGSPGATRSIDGAQLPAPPPQTQRDLVALSLLLCPPRSRNADG